MLAPFVPYITEELYRELYREEEGKASIHLAQWPKFEQKLADKETLEQGERISKVITAVRSWKHDNKMALNADISELIIEGELKGGLEDIKGRMKIKRITKGKAEIEIPETGAKEKRSQVSRIILTT